MFKIEGKKGFTLIEILVVVIIIGVLAAAIFPRISSMQSRARDVQRQLDVQNMTTAVQVYYTMNGEFLTSRCNAPGDYIVNVDPGVCQRNVPYSTSGYVEYSVFETGFLTELEGTYLSSVPKDPLHPYKTYSYSRFPDQDVAWMKAKCGGETNFARIATIGYSPEIRKKTDIVRSCPDGFARDYIGGGKVNINRETYMRQATIYEDRYKPTGNQVIPGECFDKGKNERCQ